MTKTEIANLIGELYAEEVRRRWADHEREVAEWKRTGRGNTNPPIGSPRETALFDALRKLGIPRSKVARGVSRGWRIDA